MSGRPSASSDTEDSDHEPYEVQYAPNSERNEEYEYLGEYTPLAPSSASRYDSLCSLFRSPSDAVAEDIAELAPPSPIVGEPDIDRDVDVLGGDISDVDMFEDAALDEATRGEAGIVAIGSDALPMGAVVPVAPPLGDAPADVEQVDFWFKAPWGDIRFYVARQ